MSNPSGVRDHIGRLEQDLQKSCLQALQLLGRVLTLRNKGTQLAPGQTTECLALEANYAVLQRRIEDLRVKIDLLQADEYERAYGSGPPSGPKSSS